MNKTRRFTFSVDGGRIMIVDHTTRKYMTYIPFFHYIDPEVDLEDWYKDFWKKYQVMEWYE